jgi:chromosome partitioning protein
MQVIAIANRKGGTGKTTVVVNLAAGLAAKGHHVLLIELDSQGHCAVGLGVKVSAGETAAHRIFVDPTAKLSDAIRDTAVPNLALAPADLRFDHGAGERNDTRLKTALIEENLANRFDLVVIDTAPSLDHLLMNALLASSHVLVPYVPHHLSFDGVRQLVRVLFPVMTRHNRGLKILGFLPTQSAEHVRQHRAVTGNVSAEFGASKLLPPIRSDIRLAEAMAAGQLIQHYAPKSRGAEDFARLTDEVLRRLSPAATRS